MYVESLKFWVTVATPYCSEEILLLHCLAPVLNKQCKKVKFLWCQINRRAVYYCGAVGTVQRYSVRWEYIDLIPALENTLYLCYKYIYVIRLLYVVVGSQVKPVELVSFALKCYNYKSRTPPILRRFRKGTPLKPLSLSRIFRLSDRCILETTSH